MAFSNTVPASEFTQGIAAGQREFKQNVASGQRQARLMLKIFAAIAGLALVLAIVGRFTGIGADHVVNGAAVSTFPVTMMVEGDDAVALRSAKTGE